MGHEGRRFDLVTEWWKRHRRTIFGRRMTFDWVNDILPAKRMRRNRGMGSTSGSDALRKWAGCQRLVSADVISVVVNEEYSARQRDICSENLVFWGFVFGCYALLLSPSPVCQPANLFMRSRPMEDRGSWELFCWDPAHVTRGSG